MDLSFTVLSHFARNYRICDADRCRYEDKSYGILVIDKSKSQVIWMSMSGAKVIRRFSVPREVNLEEFWSATFCLLEGKEYVAVCTSSTTITLHQTKSSDYIDISLNTRAQKLCPCTFGLFIHSKPFIDKENFRRQSYFVLSTVLSCPREVIFGNINSIIDPLLMLDDSATVSHEAIHEILCIENSLALCLTTISSKKSLTLWVLEQYQGDGAEPKIPHGGVSDMDESNRGSSPLYSFGSDSATKLNSSGGGKRWTSTSTSTSPENQRYIDAHGTK